MQDECLALTRSGRLASASASRIACSCSCACSLGVGCSRASQRRGGPTTDPGPRRAIVPVSRHASSGLGHGARRLHSGPGSCATRPPAPRARTPTKLVALLEGLHERLLHDVGWVNASGRTSTQSQTRQKSQVMAKPFELCASGKSLSSISGPWSSTRNCAVRDRRHELLGQIDLGAYCRNLQLLWYAGFSNNRTDRLAASTENGQRSWRTLLPSCKRLPVVEQLWNRILHATDPARRRGGLRRASSAGSTETLPASLHQCRRSRRS